MPYGTKHASVDNGQDIMDSREVIKYFDELDSDRNDAVIADESEATCGSWTAVDGTRFIEDWTEDQEDEYQHLKAFIDEASGTPDWRYGETLIRDSYFEDYARQLAEDIGAIKGDEQWPCSYIDWERAADALKQDYMSTEFDGVTYWVRA